MSNGNPVDFSEESLQKLANMIIQGRNPSGGGGQSEFDLSPDAIKKFKSQTSAAIPVLQMFTNAVDRMGDSYKRFRDIGGGAIGLIEDLSNYGKGKYDPIQEAFGGLANIDDISTEATRNVVATVDKMYQAHLGLDRSFMVTRNNEQINAADVFFKNEVELTNAFLRIRENLAQDQTARLDEMSAEDQTRLTMYQKGLRLSTSETAEVMRRQIALTGEASNKIFEDITKFSAAVSENSALSFQEVSDGITQIITDVKRFGNVQAEEAARIVGHLSKIGLSYQGFGSMVDKFMNFDSAAESLGNLTTVFGIHFDAMEMMQLANEDQEEFLIRMRDAFLDSGRAIEDMTLAEKRLAAQQIGVSIEDFENLMQEDRDLADLTAVTDAAKEMDAAESFQKMTEQMAIDAKTLEERSAQMRKRSLEPLAHDAYMTGEAFEVMKSQIFLDPDKFLPGYTEARTTIQELYRAAAGSDQTFDYTKSYRAQLEIIKSQAGTTGEQIERLDEVIKKSRITAADFGALAIEFPGMLDPLTRMSGEIVLAAGQSGLEAGQELAKKTVEGFSLESEQAKIREVATGNIAEVEAAIRAGIDDSDIPSKSLSPLTGQRIFDGIMSGLDIKYLGPAIDEAIPVFAKYTGDAMKTAFADSDNPVLEALASGESGVNVSVSTDSAIGSISQAVEAFSEKAETTEKEAQAKRDEQHKEIIEVFKALAAIFQQFAEKENIIDFKAMLDTDVIAQKLVRWRGSGGTTSFEVKAG